MAMPPHQGIALFLSQIFEASASGPIITVTLAIDDPVIKPALLRSIVSACADMGASADYLDLDLQFSSFLQNLTNEKYKSLEKFVTSFIPRDGRIVSDIADIVGERSTEAGLVILDSVNTLQSLLWDEESGANFARAANHRASIVITVLRQYARFNSKALLIVNLTKRRPKTLDDSSIRWEKDLVGGRMMRYKSDDIFFAREAFDQSKVPPKAMIELTLVKPGSGFFSGKYLIDPEFI